MGHKYIYKTHFKFDHKVRSVREANEFFADELVWWPGVKEDLTDWIGKDEADKIIDVTWRMTDEDCGCIKIVSTGELTDQVLEVLSKWIKNWIDDLEKDEMLIYYKDVFWYTEGVEIQVHFDHEGNDYKLKLAKVM